MAPLKEHEDEQPLSETALEELLAESMIASKLRPKHTTFDSAF